MKFFIAIIFCILTNSVNAGTVTITGKPTQIEITDRLFFRINGGVPQNPNTCSSNFRYEFTKHDGTSGENKSMALSILLTAKAMDKELDFTIHSSICSDIKYPAVIGVKFKD